ncbi:MAG: hypothetical protein WC467_01570 [Patescibacteria group bacterium]
MIKKILFSFGFLALLFMAKPVDAQYESPLTNASLMVGNTYFYVPNHGDGSYRWGEARLLFGGRNDYSPISLGVFVNYVEVGSKIDEFLYHDTEWCGGLAMNFGSKYWFPMREFWGWSNLGIKSTKDHGQKNTFNGQYDGRQNDQLFYGNIGVLLKNPEMRGPLYMQKLMLTLQSPTRQGQLTAYWDGEKIADSSLNITNKGSFRAVFENTFVTIPLNMAESLRFEPKMMFGAINQFNDHRTLFTAGIGLTLARTYSEELLVIEGNVKFDPKFGNTFYIGANLNVIELGKALFQKNY